jgi:hypothetical protein
LLGIIETTNQKATSVEVEISDHGPEKVVDEVTFENLDNA